MSDSPWFSFYVGDFVTGTMDFSPNELAAYVRLLCHQWSKGSVPINDQRRLMQVTGLLPDELEGVMPMIRAKFPDGRNRRMEREREYREKQRQNGGKGGRPKTQTKAKEKPNETQTETQTEPNPKASQSQSHKYSPTENTRERDAHARAPDSPIGKTATDLETLKSRLGTVRRGWGVEFGADERESLIRQGYLAELLAMTDDDWQDMAEMLGSSQKAADRREALKIGMPNRRTLITNVSDWLSNLERYSARHRRKTNGHAKPPVEVAPPASDEEREQMRRMIAESLKK
ncbi:MAG: DUF1376 domain-containing protein [Ilumatobacteraceae bacterium]